MRGELASVIRARVERLVDDLVSSIVAQAERQIDDALEAARSALESDLVVRDTIEMPLVGPVGRARGFRKPKNVSSDDVSSRHAGVSEPPAASGPTQSHTRNRATSSDISPSKPRERTNTCGKCGAVGFTARTCGKTHNVSGGGPTGVGRAHSGSTPAPSTIAHRDLKPSNVNDDVEDDDDTESEKTESPPPGCAKARPLRRHRGERPQAYRRAAGAADHRRFLIRSHACPLPFPR